MPVGYLVETALQCEAQRQKAGTVWQEQGSNEEVK